MGVDYYLYDEPRKELFLLGRGSWFEVFSFEPKRGDEVLQRLRDDVMHAAWLPDLVAFLQAPGRQVELGSDAADCGSVPVPYTICGSRYSDDKDRVGTTMNRWPYDHELDGWVFPKRIDV